MTGESHRARLLADLVLRDWSGKIVALVLAVILFVVTRDEVTRALEIPVRIIPDGDRVLLTDVPGTVQVEVRGPWARVNRLQPYDLGAVTLDLRAARPGPLALDPAEIVMPSGVVLSRLVYDAVDLRFEPVVQRDLPVVAALIGEPDPEFRVAKIEVRPATWPVRGGRSSVQAIGELGTERIDLSGARGVLDREVSLVPPSAAVELLGSSEPDPPRVHVQVVVDPVAGERTFDAPVRSATTDGNAALPKTVAVTVRGPLAVLRRLDALGIAPPVRGRASVTADESGRGRVEVGIEWVPEVPDEVRSALTVEPPVVRSPLAP